MKKCLLLGVGMTLAVSSCTTIHNTASTDQVDSKIVNLTVAQMDVADHHVTKTIEWNWNPFTMVSMAAQKNNVVAEAVREADADLLVEPQFTVKKRGLFRGGSITVSGRPAKYTDFRSLTQADAINMAVSQGREVVPGPQTVAPATSAKPAKPAKKDVLKVKVPSWNHSGITAKVGIGGFTVSEDGFDGKAAYDIDLGYRWHIWKGISWQIFKVGFNSSFEDRHNMTLRFTSGVRYDTPRFGWMKNRSFFVNCDLGYGFCPKVWKPSDNWDVDANGGFTYEIGAGVKLSRKLSVGVFYQHMNDTRDETYSYYNSYNHHWYYDHYYDRHVKWGVFGAKLEYQF